MSVSARLRSRLSQWPGRYFLFLLVALLVMTAWGAHAYTGGRLGPAQPISFSHRVHVTQKQISCLMCHPGALDTPHAGVPPLETCMMCHRSVIPHHPEIEKLHLAWNEKRPVAWVRVNDLPDHVFFNHGAHVLAGVDCGRCHGDVASMDRIAIAEPFTMGACVACHRESNASTGCLTCHR